MSVSLLLLVFSLLATNSVSVPPLPSTGVRLYQEGTNELPNFSMVNEDVLSAGLWCQSSANSSIGVWYFPNGTQVPDKIVNGFPLYANHSNGQIRLVIVTGVPIISYQGLYTCIIQNEIGDNETLVVAVYRNTEYTSAVSPAISGSLQFNLLSNGNINPPVFSLIFNVTMRPPTTISCTINSAVYPLQDNDINRTVLDSTHPSIRVQVNITFRTRSTGDYILSVNNSAVDNINVHPAYTNISITRTGTPFNLSAVRLNLTSAILTWSPPPQSHNVPVSGYEVFYTASGASFSQVVESGTHQVTTSFLQFNENYQIFVVAYGGNLPSNASNVVNVSTGIYFTLPTINTPLVGERNVTIHCQVSVEIPNLNFEVEWLDKEQNVIADSSMADFSNSNSKVSVEAVFDSIGLDSAGVYICVANFHQFGLLNESYTLTVQVPSPNISMSVPGSVYTAYETGYLLISCSIQLLPHTVATVNWIRLHGSLESNVSYAIRNVLSNDTMVYTSILNLTSLSVEQNNTSYKCLFNIAAESGLNNSEYIIPATVNATSDPIIVKALPTVTPVISVVNGTVPALNESISINCSVDVEENLKEFLSIQLSHNGSTTLDDDDIIATNVTSVTLILDSLQIEQLGGYRCTVTINIKAVPELIFNTSTYTLTITVLQPLNVTVYVSNDGNLIEGTYVDLICVSNVTPQFSTVTKWSFNGLPLNVSGGYTISSDGNISKLHINELMMTRDNGGQYTCTVCIDNQYITGRNSGNDTITLSVIGLNSSYVNASISNFPTPTAGDLFSLTCLVILPERLGRIPNIQWRYLSFMDMYETFTSTDEIQVGNVTINDNIVSRSLIFNPLKVSYINTYQCRATFSGLNIESDPLPLMILLPPPQLVIDTLSHPIYESTSVSFICTMTLPSAVDIMVIENGYWTDSNGQIIESNDRVTVTLADNQRTTLTFDPIDNGDHSSHNDTGVYTCHFNASSQQHRIQSSNETSVYIEVSKLPPMQLSVVPSGVSSFRHNFSLSCVVQRIHGLPINVVWLDSSTMNSLPALNQSNETELVLTLEFVNLTNDMNGSVYTCIAGYNVSLTNDMDQAQEQYMLTVSSFGLPQDFNVGGIRPFSIDLTWSPPNELNILYYQLYINFNNGSNELIIQLNSLQTNYTLVGLSPYQLINASISAFYSIGEGSMATLKSLHTAQYDPSPIRNLSVLLINNESVIISWSPSLEPNGVIIFYVLSMSRFGEAQLIININLTSSNLNYTVRELENGVAYVVAVQPANGGGVGVPVDYTFFVKEEAPPAVSNIEVSRINGTHINVSWSPLLLNESRGFVQNYSIQYNKVENKKRQVSSLVVPFDQTSVIIDNLDPTSLYSIIVFASTNGGQGIASNEAIANRPHTVSFQMRASPFSPCNEWTDSTRETIKALIRSEITGVIAQNCSCGFEEVYISGEELLCIVQYPDDIFYRANITSYGLFNSSGFLGVIRNWISGSPSINITNSTVTFDPTCPVDYDSNEVTPCDISETQPSIAAIVTAVLVVILCLIAICIILFIVIAMCKRSKFSNTRVYEMEELNENYKNDIPNENDNEKIYEQLDHESFAADSPNTKSHDSPNIPYQNNTTHLAVASNPRSITDSPLPPIPLSGSLPISLLNGSPSLPPRNPKFKTIHQGGVGKLSSSRPSSLSESKSSQPVNSLPSPHFFRFSGSHTASTQLSLAHHKLEQRYESPVSHQASPNSILRKLSPYEDPHLIHKIPPQSPSVLSTAQPYESPISRRSLLNQMSPNDDPKSPTYAEPQKLKSPTLLMSIVSELPYENPLKCLKNKKSPTSPIDLLPSPNPSSSTSLSEQPYEVPVSFSPAPDLEMSLLFEDGNNVHDQSSTDYAIPIVKAQPEKPSSPEYSLPVSPDYIEIFANKYILPESPRYTDPQQYMTPVSSLTNNSKHNQVPHTIPQEYEEPIKLAS